MKKGKEGKIWLFVLRVIGIIMALVACVHYTIPLERKILLSYMIMTLVYEGFNYKHNHVFSICLCIDAVFFFDEIWLKVLCVAILHIDLFVFFFGNSFQNHNHSI